MESVVLDKPPEYHGKCDERGFPFEEEEGGAWSDLASRHPDIAARLRPRAPPAAGAATPGVSHAAPNAQPFHRKRRPDHTDQQDFGANFDGFDRFPFDNIPPEFRGHLPPQYWNRRYEEPAHQPQQTQQHPQHPQQPQSPLPQRQTIATQTDPEDIEPKPIPLPHIPFNQIEGQNQPQGQYQPEQEAAHIPQYGLRNTVDLGQPSQPEQLGSEDRPVSAPPPTAYQHQQGPGAPRQQDHPSMSQEQQNVRVIPIQVEGRDVPVQNHRATSPAAHHPHPSATFDDGFPHSSAPFDDGFHHPSFVPPPPFRAGFNTNPRPYTNHKAYPQGQYARGVSPQRSHSPKPHNQEYVEIPVQHEAKHQQHPTPQQQQQQYQQQQQQKFQQQQQQPNQTPAQPSPPPHAQPQTKPDNKDPITQILAIQTDVLKLMTEVENFTGSKKDKQYIYLDEMLTRKILALDDIETEGKENIRAARKEAIRCIEKCIAVLEAKAEKGSQAQAAQDVEMKQDEAKAENGDANADTPKDNAEQNNEGTEQPQVDTRPDEKPDEPEKEKKGKKGGKVTKKRDKSKDKNVNKEGMQVDSNSKDSSDAQAMEVDGAAAASQ